MNTTKRKNVIVKCGLALIMAVIVLSASACGSFWDTSETPLGPDSTVNTPSDSHDTDPDTSNDSAPAPENPYSQYSQILQDVLTSEYYNGLIQEYRHGVYSYSNKYAPIPYAFLESKGYNINDIKSDALKCEVSSFIKKNDLNTLYVSVKVETKSTSDDYYTDYLLSYPITEKEYEDLCMLHKEYYLQASYFIQELDNRRTAKIENVAKIDVKTFDNFITEANTWNTIKSVFKNFVIFDILDIDPENLYVSILVRENVPQKQMLIDSQLRELKITFTAISGYKYTNYLFIDYLDRTRTFNIDEFKQTSTDIICLDSQNDASNGRDLYFFINKNNQSA